MGLFAETGLTTYSGRADARHHRLEGSGIAYVAANDFRRLSPAMELGRIASHAAHGNALLFQQREQ